MPLVVRVKPRARREISQAMQYDDAKVEDAVLALLGVFEFENGRVWKRFDFDVMEAFLAKGLISDPRGKQESVRLTGAALAPPLRRPQAASNCRSTKGRMPPCR